MSATRIIQQLFNGGAYQGLNVLWITHCFAGKCDDTAYQGLTLFDGTIYGGRGGNVMADNPDIDRYRGYFDIELAYDMPDSFKVAALLRKGTGAGKGSLQIDATYPLSRFFLGNLDVYAQVQYFTGYAETLLHYNQRYDFLRFGFAVYR